MLNYRYPGQLYSLRSAGSLITLRYSILYSSVAAIHISCSGLSPSLARSILECRRRSRHEE